MSGHDNECIYTYTRHAFCEITNHDSCILLHMIIPYNVCSCSIKVFLRTTNQYFHTISIGIKVLSIYCDQSSTIYTALTRTNSSNNYRQKATINQLAIETRAKLI